MLNLLKNNDFYLLSKIWHEISKFFIVKRTTNCINKSGHILRIFANETIRALQRFRCGLAREVPSHWELKRLKQLFVEKNISKACLLIVEPLVLVKLLKNRMIK